MKDETGNKKIKKFVARAQKSCFYYMQKNDQGDSEFIRVKGIEKLVCKELAFFDLRK